MGSRAKIEIHLVVSLQWEILDILFIQFITQLLPNFSNLILACIQSYFIYQLLLIITSDSTQTLEILKFTFFIPFPVSRAVSKSKKLACFGAGGIWKSKVRPNTTQ